MKKEINALVRDIADSEFEDIVLKYKERIPAGLKISDLTDSLEKQGLLESLVHSGWKNDGKDKNGLYLIRNDDVYEVFTCERGIKNWVREFTELKQACSYYLDGLLNELMYSAPDTEIK